MQAYLAIGFGFCPETFSKEVLDKFKDFYENLEEYDDLEFDYGLTGYGLEGYEVEDACFLLEDDVLTASILDVVNKHNQLCKGIFFNRNIIYPKYRSFKDIVTDMELAENLETDLGFIPMDCWGFYAHIYEV